MIKTKREYDDLDEISKDEWDEYYDRLDKTKNLIYDTIKRSEPTATYQETSRTEFWITIQDISFSVLLEL